MVDYLDNAENRHAHEQAEQAATVGQKNPSDGFFIDACHIKSDVVKSYHSRDMLNRAQPHVYSTPARSCAVRLTGAIVPIRSSIETAAAGTRGAVAAS